MEIIGTTKVSKGGKMTLIKDVQDLLRIKESDVLVFYKSEKGDIIIKKG